MSHDLISKNTLKSKNSNKFSFDGYFSTKNRKSLGIESVLCSGFLWKKNNYALVKKWKLQWFSLTTKYLLNFYTKSDLKTLKGTIDLLKNNIISINIAKKYEIDKLDGVVKTKIKTYPFTLKCDNGIYIFRSQTEFDRQQFVYYINNILYFKNDYNSLLGSFTNNFDDTKDDEINSILYIDIKSGHNLLKYNDFTEPTTFIEVKYQLKNQEYVDCTLPKKKNENPVYNEQFLKIFGERIYLIYIQLYRQYKKQFNQNSVSKELIGVIKINPSKFISNKNGKIVEMPFQHIMYTKNNNNINSNSLGNIGIYGSLKFSVTYDKIDDIQTNISVQKEDHLCQILMYYICHDIECQLQNAVLSNQFAVFIQQKAWTWSDLLNNTISTNKNRINGDINKTFIGVIGAEYFGLNKEKINLFWNILIQNTNKFYIKYIFGKHDNKLNFQCLIK